EEKIRGGLAVLVRRPRMRLVDIGDAFHLDDVGAHVGEQRAAPRPGDDAREIDDASAFERAGGDSHVRYYTRMTTRLSDALRERILVLDGAMGTMIQAAALTANDFGGASLDGCNEHLNLTRPDVIKAIHAAYFDAGADCVSTNTFGCAPYVLGEYGLADRAYEISLAAARLARETAGARFVLGAMGPSTRSISVTRNVSFQEVMDAYEVQAAGLIAGGADALLLETQQDTLDLKDAAIGEKQALRAAGVELPVMVSGTI